MATLKLTAVGTSTGVVIPKEMLARMRVERRDTLHVVETPEGYLELTRYRGHRDQYGWQGRRPCPGGDREMQAIELEALDHRQHKDRGGAGGRWMGDAVHHALTAEVA